MVSPTLISDLRNTSKPSEKQAILKDNDSIFFRYLLKSTYEPFENYHIKIKPSEVPEPGVLDITDPKVELLFKEIIEYCRTSNSNKKNRERVIPVLGELTKDTQDLLLGILNKNWKVGVSAKTVNKVFPGLITSFEVQLSNSYNKSIKKKSFIRKDRFSSYKLDGVRCIALRLNDEWKLFSRQGKEFLTADHIKEDLEFLYKKFGKTFFDGELYIDKTPFEEIQSYVTSFTKGTNTILDYYIFMCGRVFDFLTQKYTTEFELPSLDYETTNVKVLEQKLISDDDIETELEKAFELGYEGLMLRDPDKLYDFKRSDALLKIKESPSAKSQETISDCLVLDIEIDDFPVIENESLIYKKLLTKLIVEQKDGTICKVGSGFSLDFREYYTLNQDELNGSVIEVKHQGYGSHGKMRFPRFHRLRVDLDW